MQSAFLTDYNAMLINCVQIATGVAEPVFLKHSETHTCNTTCHQVLAQTPELLSTLHATRCVQL